MDGAVFDMRDGNRIDWSAPDVEEPPIGLYSTVAALLLAWRGAVPLHCSAVEIDGRAILIAGPAGAGKSTLAAALVDAGGRLVSDDLSVLAATDDGPPQLWPGRPAIRLVDPSAVDPLDKKLVRPAMVDVTQPVPVTTLLLLRATPIAPGPADAAQAMRRQLFRPLWMAAMPRQKERAATLLASALQIKIAIMPRGDAAPNVTPDQRAATAIALMA